MDEDLLRGRLRGLADVDAPVSVDRAAVIRVGRRRRWTRTLGPAAAVLVLAVAAYPAVAALTPDRSAVSPAGPTPAVTTPAPRAVVDRAAGTITLPVDGLRSPRDELVTTQTAQRHFLSTCMTERGFGEHWAFDGPVEPAVPPGSTAPYGVWRESDVRATGYQHAAGTDAGRSLEGDEAVASRQCEGEMVAAGLAVDVDRVTALAEEHRAGGWIRALGTDEGGALRDRWVRCLAEAGVAAPVADDPESMVPEGILEAPFDEQVRVGLLDVACKDRLDLVQRLADLDAAAQAAYLERTAEFQAAVRRLDAPVVDRARQYLVEHGVTAP
ncbi:hypothetical protein [Cellulomonas sp.]|uniref:hypothetical protein n=1 Tax=Cellulomonas sp. TaxID=40001 RepID=UPI002811E77F|nr:hypothetical protein [Cellulomonas sp.]